MNKHLLSLTAALALTAGAAWGVPACPEPGTVMQPDGTTLTVYLHGDEFMNFLTTVDGYTIVRNDKGIYTYAMLDDRGNLVAGQIAASDPSGRTTSTNVYLSGVEKYLSPSPSATALEMQADRAKFGVAPGQKGLYDYKKFKGLVILAQYNDCAFTRTDTDSIFTNMVTKKNYDGFMSNSAIPAKISYTGSVRDYFYDNSCGMFDPDFDVVGPVTIPYSQYYAQQTTNARTVVQAACTAADAEVDFSKYDTDGDGVVDMFYVIFAGGGSNFSGNDTRLIWPHAWSLSYPIIDGVRLYRYACSTELYGRPASKKIDGIGTICHEFSHVLGLMDEYDTDYSTNGQSQHPGDWSVMASGSYLNYGITPCGYSLLQRCQSGFTKPILLKEKGIYELSDIDSTNSGYRLSLPYRNNEYWLLENRRKTGNKWNSYLPGEGMLVFRVDSTNPTYWTNNKINAYSNHNYYELVRAYNPAGTKDLSSDPFPGTANITSLTPSTTPALVAWNNEEPLFGLYDITQKSNGNISFTLKEMEELDTRLEDWEEIVTATANDTRVKGNVARWDFENATVETPASGHGNGQKALGMVKSSSALVGPINGQTKTVAFTISNSAARGAYFQLQYKDENGNWIALYNTDGTSNISLGSQSKLTPTFLIPEGVRKNMTLRVRISQGDSSKKIYLDDFTTRMIVDDEYLRIDSPFVSPGENLKWTRQGSELIVSAADGSEVRLYSIQGSLISSSKANCGIARLPIPASGLYLLCSEGKTIKVIL